MAKKDKTDWSVSSDSQTPLMNVVVLGILLLIVLLGWGWWRMNGGGAEKVFYDMFNANMQVRGLAKQTEQHGAGQTLTQTIQLQTGASHHAQAIAKLSQEGEGATSVTTESIGTPDEDFVRYTEISTASSNNREVLNFDALIGVWGRSNNQTLGGPRTDGELYGQMVLGVVPTGYVHPSERSNIIRSIKDREVYKINFAAVKRERVNGRPHYIYEVHMEPERYVAMLKDFAAAVGLEQLKDLDPSSYSNSSTLIFEFVVDIWSRQLREVRYVGNERVEKFSDYGVEKIITIPDNSVPIEELQSRLQEIAQ